MKPVLLYLHGFNSSPASSKAEMMQRVCATLRPDILFLAPQIPTYPVSAFESLEMLLRPYVASGAPLGIVGSSLGGFWATCLAERFNCRVAIINPAVHPYRLLRHYLGMGENPYTKERYCLEPHHMEELQALEPDMIDPSRYWVLLQQGDEVLDYRQAAAFYHGALVTIEPGGDHRFTGFERFPEQIIQFLQI